MSAHWRRKDARYMRETWIKLHQWTERVIIFVQFVGQVFGDNVDTPPVYTFRKRRDYIFTPGIHALDKDFQGQWATGEIEVFSTFLIQGADFKGARPSDRVIYLNSEFVVADQPSSVLLGAEGPVIFYKTVMRRSDRKIDTDVPVGELMQVAEEALAS